MKDEIAIVNIAMNVPPRIIKLGGDRFICFVNHNLSNEDIMFLTVKYGGGYSLETCTTDFRTPKKLELSTFAGFCLPDAILDGMIKQAELFTS